MEIACIIRFMTLSFNLKTSVCASSHLSLDQCRTASARTAATSLSGDGWRRTVRLTTPCWDRRIVTFHCTSEQRDLYFRINAVTRQSLFVRNWYGGLCARYRGGPRHHGLLSHGGRGLERRSSFHTFALLMRATEISQRSRAKPCIQLLVISRPCDVRKPITRRPGRPMNFVKCSRPTQSIHF